MIDKAILDGKGPTELLVALSPRTEEAIRHRFAMRKTALLGRRRPSDEIKHVVDLITEGLTIDEIQLKYPHLSTGDVRSLAANSGLACRAKNDRQYHRTPWTEAEDSIVKSASTLQQMTERLKSRSAASIWARVKHLRVTEELHEAPKSTKCRWTTKEHSIFVSGMTNGIPLREIAKELDKTYHSIKSRLHWLRNKNKANPSL